MTIRQAIERALFGASAEEIVALRVKLIDQRVQRALDRLADALEQDSASEQDSERQEERQEGEGAQGR